MSEVVMADEPTLSEIDEALTETAKTLRHCITEQQRAVVAEYLDSLLDDRLVAVSAG